LDAEAMMMLAKMQAVADKRSQRLDSLTGHARSGGLRTSSNAVSGRPYGFVLDRSPDGSGPICIVLLNGDNLH
jgi:hypothetical protein